GNADKAEKTAVFTPSIPKSGRYEVRISYTPHRNRATNVKVTVTHAEGTAVHTINQRRKPSKGSFRSLATYRFLAGKAGRITVSATGTNGYVIVDAVQLLRVKPAGGGRN
ncbi:MAG: FAD-dependent oxidoreductase, partial [Planctomycetaceae bacterium]